MSVVGYHIQRPAPDWLTAVAKLPPGSPVLAVDGVQWLAEAKSANPEVFTVLRHWNDPYQVFPLEWSLEQYKEHARGFFEQFIDETFREYAWAVDAVKEFNEYWANSQSQEEVDARLKWVQAVCEVWDLEYRSQPDYGHIKLVIGSAAIGNDMPLGVAKFAIAWEAIVSYHAYWYTVNGEQPEWEWGTLSGRWDLMDMQWQEAGYKVDWIFTECGPFESAVTGWRSGIVCGNDVGCYLRSIQYWRDHVVTTPAYKEGRVIGGTLFTTYPGGDWEGFETQQPEMDLIAELAASWEDAPDPPDPPDPEPDPCFGKPRTDYARTFLVIPENATEERAVEIFLEGWREGRRTVGGSYDDAGIGDLSDKTAILYDLPEDVHENFISWYEKFYPFTNVEFRQKELTIFPWPVITNDKRVTSYFNDSRDYGDHEGIDLAANINDPVIAVHPGKVVWASDKRRSDGQPSAYGNHVIIEHSNGNMITWYAHLEDFNVAAGDIVFDHNVIGYAGNTGDSTGPHLHFTLQIPGSGLSGYVVPDVVDPAPYLGV